MQYALEVFDMKKNHKEIKEETIIFRAPTKAVKSLDHLAKLIGTTRSEALRRLIPDLASRKELQKY